jgi:phosphate transport system protein
VPTALGGKKAYSGRRRAVRREASRKGKRMERHFDEELRELKERLLAMAGLVEDAIRKVMAALQTRNAQLAESIFDVDKRVDELEMAIEEKCIELIALRQPMASDLRFLVGVIKINNDLERIGDHAVNIAQSTKAVLHEPPAWFPIDLPRMAELALQMLRDSLDSFVTGDVDKANEVCAQDSQVDRLKRDFIVNTLMYAPAHPEKTAESIQLILVSRNLERIADLSTNIAEEVIYITQARVIKHRAEERKRSPKEPMQE